MLPRVLCVDDDANILAGLQRQLRRHYRLETAQSPEKALDLLQGNASFAVIVSDFRMPGMDGVQFLARARERTPDSVRIMLTGHADLDTAIQAVNEGNIFRLLTKPCPNLTLTKAIDAGVDQYNLVRSERELLEKTLAGSVKILADVLALVSPAAFGRATRVRRLVRQLMDEMGMVGNWQMEVAATLSQVGCVAVPVEVLEKAIRNERMTAPERAVFDSHPGVGYDLIANIPRLEGVAEIISFQELPYSGDGSGADVPQGGAIPIGARILHVAIHFDNHVAAGKNRRQALTELLRRRSAYDPEVLEALEAVVRAESTYEVQAVPLRDLEPGMLLAEDVTTTNGLLVIAKGQDVTPSLKTRLANFARTMPIQEPIQVLVAVGSHAGRNGADPDAVHG